MKKRVLPLLAIAAAAVFALSRPRPAPLAINAAAPAFRLANLAGQTVSLADYKGKVVLINFWASWCESCQQEMPVLEAAYRKHRAQGFELLAPSLDSKGRKTVLPFVARYAPSFTILLADSRIAQDYGVRALPSLFLISADGTLLRRYVGGVEPVDLENDILKALERRKS